MSTRNGRIRGTCRGSAAPGPFKIREYRAGDQNDVVEPGISCDLTVPWNNPVLDIERKLKVDPELFLVGEEDGRILASVMGGYDGHRGWVNNLAVHPKYRRQGLGSEIMAEVERLIRTS